MRAQNILAENIRSLLVAQHKTQVDLARAFAPARTKSWINKILNGHRSLQIEDFDVVADFFHLNSYHLLQPGVSSTTERRAGQRRMRQDRRHSDSERELLMTSYEVERVHSPAHRGRGATLAVASSFDTRRQDLERLVREVAARLDPFIQEKEPGRQTAVVSVARTKGAVRARTARGRTDPAVQIKRAKR